MGNTYIGFDYGSTNVAVGVLQGDEIQTHFVKFDSKEHPNYIHLVIESAIRFHIFGKQIEKLPTPCYVFIESAFKGPNADTYKKMVRVGHSIDIVCGQMKGFTQYLDNNTWRKLIFDKGNTKKEIAQEWAYSQWPFLLEFSKKERGHLADALMIAKAGKILTENNG